MIFTYFGQPELIMGNLLMISTVSKSFTPTTACSSRLFGCDGYNYTPQKTDSPTDKCQPAATQVLPLSILVAVGREDGRSLIATRKGAKKGDSRKSSLSLNLPAPWRKTPIRRMTGTVYMKLIKIADLMWC